jgi:hypothetical protein
VLAVGNFNSVLGLQRGSVSAQAQRDATEKALRVSGQQQFLDGVEAAGYPRTHVQALIDAYESGRGRVGAEGYEELVQELMSLEGGVDFSYFPYIIERGDPVGSPGLTNPAITALARTLSEGSSKQQTIIFIQAREIVADCLPGWRSKFEREPESFEKYYERLRPLVEAIAALMVVEKKNKVLRKSEDVGAKQTELCDRVARALRNAPPAVIEGTLSSWVAAFRQRISDSRVGPGELGILSGMVADQISNSVLDNEPALGFEALAADLGWNGRSVG